MALARFLKRYDLQVEKALIARHVGVKPTVRHFYPVSGYLMNVRGTIRGKPFSAVGEWIMPDDRSDRTWEDLEALASALPGATVCMRPGYEQEFLNDLDVSPFARSVLETVSINGFERLRGIPHYRRQSEIAVKELKLPTTMSSLRSHRRLSKVTSKLKSEAPGEMRIKVRGNADLDNARIELALTAATDAQYNGRIWIEGAAADTAGAADLVEIAASFPRSTGPIVLCDLVADETELKQLWDLVEPSLVQSKGRLRLAVSNGIDSVDRLTNIRAEYPGLGVCLDPLQWSSLTEFAHLDAPRRSLKEGPIWLKRVPYASNSFRATESWVYQQIPGVGGIIAAGSEKPWPSLLSNQSVDLEALAKTANKFTVFHAPTTTEVPAIESAPGRSENDFFDQYAPGLQALTSLSLREIRAWQMGLSVRTFSTKMMLLEQVGFDGVAGFKDLVGQGTSYAGRQLSADKGTTRKQLEDCGLPIAKGFTVSHKDAGKAIELAAGIGFPLVVKPSNGLKGRGITTNIRSNDELQEAITYAAKTGRAQNGVVVEEHVEGCDYRLLTLNESVVSVLRREPGTVMGDGHRTVMELMISNNVARRRNPHLQWRTIHVGPALDRTLAAQGLTLESVPEPGHVITLVQVASISQGGDSIGVLHETHPSILELAAKAAAALNMAQAGVDILMPDHRLSVDNQKLTITELNSNAALNSHLYPRFGTPVDVNEKVVRHVAHEAGLRPSEATSDPAVRMYAYGHVQGVGFRMWLQAAAIELGLQGWVRNHADGSVVAHLQGPIRLVSYLVALSRTGPKSAHVSELLTEPVPAEEVHGFVIRS